MTPLEIFEAIWAAEASSIPFVQVVNWNVDTDTLPDVWAGADYQPQTREDVTMGSTPWVEETGQFVIGLFARAGTGAKVLDSQVETVRRAFHGAALNGLVILSVDGPHDMAPEADGEWWPLVMNARYVFQSIRRQDGPLYHGWQGFEEQSQP